MIDGRKATASGECLDGVVVANKPCSFEVDTRMVNGTAPLVVSITCKTFKITASSFFSGRQFTLPFSLLTIHVPGSLNTEDKNSGKRTIRPNDTVYVVRSKCNEKMRHARLSPINSFSFIEIDRGFLALGIVYVSSTWLIQQLCTGHSHMPYCVWMSCFCRPLVRILTFVERGMMSLCGFL